MRVELVDGSAEVFDRLGQLYQYDFAEFTGDRINPDGRYDWIDVEARRSERYLISADGCVAGFIFVSRDVSRTGADGQVWWIDEFFVLRECRRLGVGDRAARAAFDARSGTWEVGQLATNPPAQAFWRAVIGRYTGGRFEEFVLDDEDVWTGPIQRFRSGGATPAGGR